MDAGGDRRGGKGCRISAVTRPLSSRRDLARLRSDVLDAGTAIEAVAGRRGTHGKRGIRHWAWLFPCALDVMAVRLGYATGAGDVNARGAPFPFQVDGTAFALARLSARATGPEFARLPRSLAA
jgi:hypothetical protein